MKKLIISFLGIGMLLSCNPDNSQNHSWTHYLGDASSSQSSTLDQINKTNVDQLEVAWTYSAGDDTQDNKTQIQCNPIIIDGTLYGSSAYLKIFALDAVTGKEKWRFDPFAATGFQHPGMGVNRGISYWTDGNETRILFTAASTLYCLDATTGNLISDFGENGKVNLLKGLDRNIDDLFLVSNTPGIIFEDLLILGSRVSENIGAAPGHIRAFNVKTGEQVWIFHTIPFPGEEGYETWPETAWQYTGGANAWSGFSLDSKNEIVFVPTGSAATDFYGGDRLGDNLFANCLLALNANTGERIWHYQFVHHDLWDRDLPAPPNLITINKDGTTIEAVAQITKSAHIFVFDRKSGEPLFPIEEVTVPASTLDGEVAAATQPVPVLPKPFSRNRMLEEDITRRTPEAYAQVKSRWDTLLEGPHFVPPSTQGSIIFPGLDGGGEWGGAAFDGEAKNLIINASEMPWVLQMIKLETNPKNFLAKGKKIYNTYCASCHGSDLKGGEMFGNVPDLNNLKARMDQPTLA
ncbi:MAG: PQQ-binding-like beta-propeller repeat protein, partial [Bacteroidota bacterium]